LLAHHCCELRNVLACHIFMTRIENGANNNKAPSIRKDVVLLQHIFAHLTCFGSL
jgi:hypothetical protein